MTIRAIVFDLDDTLIVDEVISREAMKATAGVAFRSHGAQVGPFLEAVKRLGGTIWDQGPLRAECEEIGITLEECLWGGFESQARLREWALEARRRLFDAALREQGIEDEEAPEELAVEFATARRKLQRLMPDAAETIRRLKSSFLIGLLTNGDPDLQRGKIHDSGLGGFFDPGGLSTDLGGLGRCGDRGCNGRQQPPTRYPWGKKGGACCEHLVAGARVGGICRCPARCHDHRSPRIARAFGGEACERAVLLLERHLCLKFERSKVSPQPPLLPLPSPACPTMS
ncbi:HAD family hydrolase [bacterium]|nr:HAD family hydrolase [bacterium]